MYIFMDMGTSNTRLWLYDGEVCLAERRAPFGAGSTKKEGRAFLLQSLRTLIGALLSDASASENEIDGIYAAGMAGSELGIAEVAHGSIPADPYALAERVQTVSLPEVSAAPFSIVAGLKKQNDDTLLDMMRGEETETAGLLFSGAIPEDALLVLPGTHNKIIRIERGAVADFATTLTGEMLGGIITSSILSGDVAHGFTPDLSGLHGGAEYARANGLSAALFHIRVLSKNQKEKDYLSSFLYGAVLAEEICLICRMAGELPIYVGGRQELRCAYTTLLGESATPLSEELAASATLTGLRKIAELCACRARRDTVLSAIERERLIAIVRRPDPATLMPAVAALYDGGVRLLELTFDQSGTVSNETTAEQIRAIRTAYGDRLLVGAGTVMTREQTLLAYRAGASYIISPNCDVEIITLARRLGLVSIPAAFTPSEIARATAAGADYVKLFPADALPAGYARAVLAPLSNCRLLAVGGVSLDNIDTWLSRGFSGVGIGSALYDKKLIDRGDYAALTELARAFISAVQKCK